MNSPRVDILIIGSGPVGATFAAVLNRRFPQSKILMVDLGPQLTRRPGMNLKNLDDVQERIQAQVHSQGPSAYAYQTPTVAERAAVATSGRVDFLARPGTHLVDPEDFSHGMPAAALSSNVGGMGAHWTCACPRPSNGERISFISEQEWASLCAKAEAWLNVNQQVYPASAEGVAIKQALSQTFAGRLDRGVQPMPLACRLDASGKRYWTGSDDLLGGLSGGFELRSQTLCRRLLHDGRRVSGVVLEHLPSGQVEEVKARLVIVAADAIRTPQLLWASEIGPKALGHYLNDQPQVVWGVALDQSLVEQTSGLPKARARDEAMVGVFWVPFHSSGHPFHGQVMHLDVSPISLEHEARLAQQVVGLGWFCRKELRFENCLEFSQSQTDHLGMPKIHIHYRLTPTDHASIAAAKQAVAHAAAALGKPLGDEPMLLPAGSSLHYQGTVRMGLADDGYSVCDGYSRVWGMENLLVGGNGVIPTATACNPTLTSVALAIRACEQLDKGSVG